MTNFVTPLSKILRTGSDHHVFKTRMNHITTWTYPLPSYMYGLHASYHHMDLPTTIMCIRHGQILSLHGHTTILLFLF